MQFVLGQGYFVWNQEIRRCKWLKTIIITIPGKTLLSMFVMVNIKALSSLGDEYERF